MLPSLRSRIANANPFSNENPDKKVLHEIVIILTHIEGEPTLQRDLIAFAEEGDNKYGYEGYEGYKKCVQERIGYYYLS